MNPKPLTPDQVEALHAAGEEPLPVIDPTNQHVYLVVDPDVHERAMKALRQQETLASIQRGLEGPGMTLEESQRRTEEAIRQHAKQ